MSQLTHASLNVFLRSEGWHVVGTGGGNEAWEKSVGSDGHYLWLTDDDGLSLPDTVNSRALLGLYNRDGECLGDVRDFDTVTGACIAADEIVRQFARIGPSSDPGSRF